MAARRQRRDDPAVVERGDEDALDPVEAADVDDDTDELEDAGMSEIDDEFDEDDDEDGNDEDDDESVEVPLEEGLSAEDDDATTSVTTAIPADAAFDDEDESRVVAAVVNEDDDDDSGIDGLRDEEFVCRSCYMAKRDSQLADPERMLCRDCA